MPESDLNEALLKKLLEDDKAQKAQIRELKRSNLTMKSALISIACFQWIAWSADYSPRTIAEDALRQV